MLKTAKAPRAETTVNKVFNYIDSICIGKLIEFPMAGRPNDNSDVNTKI